MTRLSVRVTVAAALAVFVAVAVLGVATRLIVSHELERSLDATLRARATDVARLSASAPALLRTPGALDAPFGGRELTIEIVDRRRRIVARSSALGGRRLLAPAQVDGAIARGATSFRDGELSGAPVRQIVAPLADLGGGPAAGGAVIVGASTRQIDDTNDRLRSLILRFALAAAGAGAVAAALLTRRGLAPLRRLAAGAGAIAADGDAQARLPPGGPGEIGALTDSLNAMLAALARAQATERRFLADASHELRTPVTALVGNAEHLARHGADPETIADLRADAVRMARLVDDLLALERGRADDGVTARSPVDVAAAARAAAAGRPRTHVHTPDGPVWVLGDPAALERAIANLVENAHVHGPARGAVTVAVAAAGGHVTVTVADEGPGLGPDAALHSFERFWRGADAVTDGRPGSGLGLAIVRATARAHGGDVRVHGPRFAITLPAAPGRSSETHHDPRVA